MTVVWDGIERRKDCRLCGCPTSIHTSNGFIVWCEHGNCKGHPEGGPCIKSADTQERMPAYYTGTSENKKARKQFHSNSAGIAAPAETVLHNQRPDDELRCFRSPLGLFIFEAR